MRHAGALEWLLRSTLSGIRALVSPNVRVTFLTPTKRCRKPEKLMSQFKNLAVVVGQEYGVDVAPTHTRLRRWMENKNYLCADGVHLTSEAKGHIVLHIIAVH